MSRSAEPREHSPRIDRALDHLLDPLEPQTRGVRTRRRIRPIDGRLLFEPALFEIDWTAPKRPSHRLARTWSRVLHSRRLRYRLARLGVQLALLAAICAVVVWVVIIR
jgi:hypothetical protein